MAKPKVTTSSMEIRVAAKALGFDPTAEQMEMISRVRRKNGSAAALLRSLIQSGTLEIGSAVNASALADILGLHRNTLVRTIAELAKRGYLKTHSGRPAVVVSDRPTLPEHQAQFFSHCRMAIRSGLEMRSRSFVIDSMRVGKIDRRHRDAVEQRLELDPEDTVFLMQRIRSVQGRATMHRWVAAGAETAYFAAKRLPSYFLGDLEAHVIDAGSVKDYFEAHDIDPVTGEYSLTLSQLPKDFHEEWNDPESARADLFIALEATTYSHWGPIEHSIAYVLHDLVDVSASNLRMDYRNDELGRRATVRRKLKQVAKPTQGRQARGRGRRVRA